MLGENTRKLELEVLTAAIVDKFDPALDPVSQIIEYKKIENTVIDLKDPLIIETENDTFSFAAGQYQIIDSKLMVLVSRSES